MYITALLMASIGILAFTVVPSQTNGFWQKNGYTLPDNDLQSLNRTDQTATTIQTMTCDINPEDESCDDIERTSLVDAASNIFQGIVGGGFGALISIIKSLGYAKTMIDSIGLQLGIPPFITNAIISLLIMSITLTILMIIFNRTPYS